MPEEETTTTTDDKELNFRALEAELAESRAREDALLKEVSPFRAQTAIREAGFDPDTDRGKVLADLLGPDDGVERVKELADKYGWNAAPPVTATEAEQVQGAAAAGPGTTGDFSRRARKCPRSNRSRGSGRRFSDGGDAQGRPTKDGLTHLELRASM